MEEEMFLKSEYLKTLKLIVDWENTLFCRGHRDDKSLEKVFVLKLEYRDYDNKYYQYIYLIPDKRGIYLLCLLSKSYNNVRVVPQVVWDLVKRNNNEENLMIMQLDENIENVRLAQISSGKGTRMKFGFWAVTNIPFKGITLGLFREKLDHFSLRANKLENDFDELYYIC